MNKYFVPFYESSELKYLGFDEDCLGYYYNVLGSDNANLFIKETNKEIYRMIKIPEDEYTLAPIFSQAFRFFREKYNWQHSIQATSDQHRSELGYNYWIWNNKTGEEHYTMPKNRPIGDWEYETYEEAELECLKHLIKIERN